MSRGDVEVEPQNLAALQPITRFLRKPGYNSFSKHVLVCVYPMAL